MRLIDRIWVELGFQTETRAFVILGFSHSAIHKVAGIELNTGPVCIAVHLNAGLFGIYTAKCSSVRQKLWS